MGYSGACKRCGVKDAQNYYSQNKDKVHEYKREWHIQNRNNVLNRAKDWRKANSIHKQEYQRDYYKNNPQIVAECNKRRQHKNHKISKKEWHDCKQYFDFACAYCGMTEQEHRDLFKQDLHKEHVNPNGSGNLDNCVPACRICNSEKWEYNLDEWYNFNNIRFHPDKYFKIKQWIEYDNHKFATK